MYHVDIFTEGPNPQYVDAPTLRYLDDDSVASLASNTSCGFCKGRLNWGETGVIQSPNFPEPYGPNMDCLWLLMAADEDARIQVNTLTIFNWIGYKLGVKSYTK